MLKLENYFFLKLDLWKTCGTAKPPEPFAEGLKTLFATSYLLRKQNFYSWAFQTYWELKTNTISHLKHRENFFNRIKPLWILICCVWDVLYSWKSSLIECQTRILSKYISTRTFFIEKLFLLWRGTSLRQPLENLVFFFHMIIKPMGRESVSEYMYFFLFTEKFLFRENKKREKTSLKSICKCKK